jgi:ABC-type sugar transport system ATPase subunit
LSQIELRQLAKSFPGGTKALEPLDLTVAAGELLVVLGPSGSGKTTLLRLIAGLDSPSSGSVWIEGRDVMRVPPHRRDVAMVFQSPALYPHLSVYQNLESALRRRGIPRQQAKARISTVAGLLEIDKLLSRRPAALSGGERQRVALGKALVREPRVILLDEPFSGLDAPLRADLRRALVVLHRRLETTLVHVTHDQAEALLLGDRVAVLHQGRLLQCGTPRDVYDHPADRFVATFVGSPPMNIIPCEVQREGHSITIRALEFDRASEWTTSSECLPASWDEATRHLELGIRPEAITLRNDLGSIEPCPAWPCWTATVRQHEFNGPDVLVTVTDAHHRLVVRLPSHQAVAEGQRVGVVLDMSRAVWFEPQTGAALPIRNRNPE